MLRLIPAVSLLLIPFLLFAQTKIPSFGKVDKADLEMTDCNFDKGADAVILIYNCKMFYDRGTAGVTMFKTIYDYRVRIKILKDNGLSYANVEIPFYSHNYDEKISNIDANTYNLDENGKVKITAVSKSSVYTKKINKRYSRLIIAFPEVKVGSVIEYRYKLARETFFNIKDWNFQVEIPVKYSEYEVQAPDIIKFRHQKFVIDKLDEKQTSNDDIVSIDNGAYEFKMIKTVYSMSELKGIRRSPFMGSVKDYQQRIEFQLESVRRSKDDIKYINSSWSDIITTLKEDVDFGSQLKKEITDLNTVIQRALTIQDINGRINYLYNAVRNVMTCTDHEAIFSENGVLKAWETKNGNIADINFILINVLNKAGVKSMPILLSTRDNGLVNKMYYSPAQFNSIMVYIPFEKEFLVLDATDKTSNYRLTPVSIVNSSGFVIEGDVGRWVDVSDFIHKYQVVVALQGKIDEKGIMKGECAVNSSDYARKQRVDAISKGMESFKHDYFVKPYPSVSVEDIALVNLEKDSLPLSQKITYSFPLSNTGGYFYFNTNLFNDIEKNPFIEDERQTDIDFGFLQEYLFFGNFTIPEGYVFETLPENISMTMLDKSIQFTRLMNESGNILNIRINIDFKNTFYPSGIYPDFQEFYKKMFNSLNEQIVIKKKL